MVQAVEESDEEQRVRATTGRKLEPSKMASSMTLASSASSTGSDEPRCLERVAASPTMRHCGNPSAA